MTASSNEVYEVALIGFGPTGTTIANLLGQAGIRVLVIEQDADIYDQSRAIGFDHEVMRIFQAAGVADDVRPHTAPMRGGHYLGAQGQIIREFIPLEPPYALGWPPNFVFDQPGLEGALRLGVSRHPSVDVRLRHEFETAVDAEGHVALTVRDIEQDEIVMFRAKYVIGCDGARSRVRQLCDIDFEDLGFDEPWLVIDVYVKDPDKFPQLNIQFADPKRPMTFVVGPGNHRRWEMMLMPGETPEQIDQLPRILELLKPFGTPKDFEIRRSATYRFHALVAAEWRQGRFLLAGDAAHQTPPFIGQGMCQGIRDASALSWRLISILRDDVTDAILDSYTIERKPHVVTVTTRTMHLGQEICMLDADKAAERDRRLEAERQSGQQLSTRQELIPGFVAGQIDLAGLTKPEDRVGKLVHQPLVQPPGGVPQRLDDVLGSAFWILFNGANPAADLTDDQSGFWRRINGRIATIYGPDTIAEASGSHPLQDIDGFVTDYFDRADATAVIVRPDRYIYGVAHNLEDLNHLLGDLQDEMIVQPS